MGGNINGPALSRKMGDLTFLKFTTKDQGFISFTPANDFAVNTVVESPVSRSKNDFFSISPNPVSDYLTVDFGTAIDKDAMISIENIMGQNVFQTILSKNRINNNSFVIHVDAFESGTYSIRIIDSFGLATIKKFVKI